jgi:hypothetical protein
LKAKVVPFANILDSDDDVLELEFEITRTVRHIDS